MILTIHQPEHLVWLGLIKKIADADHFVILDSVQFKKNYYENRNKIRTKDDWMWLTVPVQQHPLDTLLEDMKISYTLPWQKKYLKAVRVNYAKTPYFAQYYPALERIILGAGESLAKLNIALLKFALDAFGVITPITFSSSLGISRDIHGSDLCLEICKRMHANTYLAGPSGRDYLKLDTFKNACIEVQFHEFHHPEYPHIHGGPKPYMGFIDLLFMEGPQAKKTLGLQ